MLAIWKLNKTKNRVLAYRLHDMADQYDPQPTGDFRGYWEIQR